MWVSRKANQILMTPSQSSPWTQLISTWNTLSPSLPLSLSPYRQRATLPFPYVPLRSCFWDWKLPKQTLKIFAIPYASLRIPWYTNDIWYISISIYIYMYSTHTCIYIYIYIFLYVYLFSLRFSLRFFQLDPTPAIFALAVSASVWAFWQMNYITYIKNGGYYFTMCIPRLLFACFSESRFWKNQTEDIMSKWCQDQSRKRCCGRVGGGCRGSALVASIWSVDFEPHLLFGVILYLSGRGVICSQNQTGDTISMVIWYPMPKLVFLLYTIHFASSIYLF